MKIGLRTRVRTDSIERYEAAHREVPEEVVAAVRRAGFSEWHIFRDGADSFHSRCARRCSIPCRVACAR